MWDRHLAGDRRLTGRSLQKRGRESSTPPTGQWTKLARTVPASLLLEAISELEKILKCVESNGELLADLRSHPPQGLLRRGRAPRRAPRHGRACTPRRCRPPRGRGDAEAALRHPGARGGGVASPLSGPREATRVPAQGGVGVGGREARAPRRRSGVVRLRRLGGSDQLRGAR